MWNAIKRQVFLIRAAPSKHGRRKNLLSVCLVTALTLPDGRYAVVITETRPSEVNVSKSFDGAALDHDLQSTPESPKP